MRLFWDPKSAQEIKMVLPKIYTKIR